MLVGLAGLVALACAVVPGLVRVVWLVRFVFCLGPFGGRVGRLAVFGLLLVSRWVFYAEKVCLQRKYLDKLDSELAQGSWPSFRFQARCG